MAKSHVIQSQVQLWTKYLPHVKPFYAVKCNDNSKLLEDLRTMNTGFDCASLKEVVSAKTESRNIIYANPCKIPHEIGEVQRCGVTRTVIDSVEELDKLMAEGWKGDVLVRLLVDDVGSLQPFGAKFGAPPEWWPEICRALASSGIHCSGVSFHVGSECMRPENYYNAIHRCRQFIDLLAQHQRAPVNCIDIGGGFFAYEDKFAPCAEQIKKAKYDFFRDDLTINWISEPGRFFATKYIDLYVPVIGKKKRLDGNGWRYTIDESLYGSFSNIPFDHQTVTPHIAWRQRKENAEFRTEIYGRTCDSGDCLGKDYQLPELDVGDWLIFKDMGAYTTVTASEFNGFQKTRVLVSDAC